MNDMTKEQQDQSPQYLQQASPGMRLRQAREAAGLSRGEVALHMHLNERKIQALEEDNYGAFPSETYVSGYLRSYAKVLGLPAGDFVRPVSSTQLPPSLAPATGKRKQASSMDLPVRMVTYAIVGVVVASLAMWWVSQREKAETKPVEQPATAQAETNQKVKEQEADNTVVVEETATEQTDTLAVDEGTNAQAEMNAGAMPSVAEPTSQAQPEPVTKAEPEPPAKVVQQDPAAPPTVMSQMMNNENQAAVAETAPATSPPPLTDNMPHSKLVLEYQNDSWTEVSDNAGRQLVYGLMRAGQTIEIKGEAPFKVFLGFAEGATVYYNNKLFDDTPYRRGEVARFHVGRTEHNQLGSR